MPAELHAHACFLSRFHGLVRQPGAEQISLRRGGTIAAVWHSVLWDELQDPLSSFVPDLSPASAGFFFATRGDGVTTSDLSAGDVAADPDLAPLVINPN